MKSFLKLIIILGSILFIILVTLPKSKYTREYVLTPRKCCKDTSRTVLLMKKDLSIDTVHVVVPKNSYIKGTSLYIPANQKRSYIPVLDMQQEWRLKDYSDVDSRVIRAMFLEEGVVLERSTD